MKDPVFASKLAFHNLDDYYKWITTSKSTRIYIQGRDVLCYWAQYLERKAENLDVQLLANTRVDNGVWGGCPELNSP